MTWNLADRRQLSDKNLIALRYIGQPRCGKQPLRARVVFMKTVVNSDYDPIKKGCFTVCVEETSTRSIRVLLFNVFTLHFHRYRVDNFTVTELYNGICFQQHTGSESCKCLICNSQLYQERVGKSSCELWGSRRSVNSR